MPGHVYERNGIYWVKFYHEGRQYRRSTKLTDRKEARKILEGYLGQCAMGTFKGFAEETVSMTALFDTFEQDCKRRKLRDLDGVRYHLLPVRKWFGAMQVPHVSERDIDRYIEHRLHLGRSTTTVNRELQYLGQAMRLAKKKKRIDAMPVIEKFSEKENARQGFFEHEQFERVVACLPDDLQDYVRFAYYTGWRKGEVAQLAWRHIEGDVVRLPPEIAKNKNGRVLVLVDELADVIARRRAGRRDLMPLVFYRATGMPVQHFYRSWKTACQKAGVPLERLGDFRKRVYPVRVRR